MTTPTTAPKIDIEATLDTMATALRERQAEQALMIGIHSGGVWIAERLHRRLQLAEPLGTLDISFYRDDFTRIGLHPEVKASNLPVDVDGRDIVLVDDVLHTGRTIRAGMNEIFDYGRPASITLAVLLERGGRELPIQADIVGQQLSLARNQHIKLSVQESAKGGAKLYLVLQEVTG